MSYTTIEAAVATVIKKHADFDSTNVIRGENAAIKKGLARVVRLRYGGHRREEITLRSILNTWTTNIDLYVPWRGQIAELETRFQTEFQKIIDTVEAWPKLNSTTGVITADLLNADSPLPLEPTKGGYRGQRLVLETQESVTPTRSE